PTTTVFLGEILHFLDDPGAEQTPGSFEHHPEGALVVTPDGDVDWVGPATALRPRHRHAPHVDHRGSLLLPGFVDPHIHSSQIDAIASPGETFQDWLTHSVYPREREFHDRDHARQAADFLLDTLLAAGTTTAGVFPTVHPASVDGFLSAALDRDLRMISGKVLMDRAPHAPEGLRDPTLATAEHQTRDLVARWHGRGRLGYALSPRFAPTSTEALLTMVARLHRDLPDLWIHSHAAENQEEVALVHRLFGADSVLALFDAHGLLGPRSVLAHCVHIDDTNRQRLARTGTAVAHCPTSNLFLGSGLFDLTSALDAGIPVGVGTDVGAGTSYSPLVTLNAAHTVAALRGHPLPAPRAFYLATLGGARALRLDGAIGSLQPGREADFVVLDWAATPVLRRRTRRARTLSERLLALMTLGDDRAVTATYVLGRPRHRRPAVPDHPR
uniref:guanine deaminase n=1 Tax=Actinoalloteichus spitiensis TaxID=252394 RepID=UPI0003778B86